MRRYRADWPGKIRDTSLSSKLMRELRTSETNADDRQAADARSGASPFVHLTLCRYADRETNRQQTLPALHICGATDDGVYKEEPQMWYSSILEIVCGHARKKCCTRDRMQVVEPIPQLVARVRVRISERNRS